MFFRRSTRFWVIKKRGPFLLLLLSLILISFLTTFILIEKNMEPTIIAIADARVRQIAVTYINKVVTQKIVNNVEYEDLIKIHKDDRGRLVLIQPNIIKIDKLQSETVSEVNKALSNLPKEKVEIPLGQVLGSQLLASYGPGIKVSMLPIGTVQVKPINTFEEAGINQTRHMLSLKVESQVKIVVPLVSSNVTVDTEILIADNIILGEVPSEYTKIDLDNAINKSLLKSLK